MKNVETKKPLKEGFSFRPELITSGPDGEHVVVDANHYILLHSLTQGTIYYTPRENKYWTAPGKECSAELFKEKFLPYLRWNYDGELVEEALAVEDPETGKVRQLKTGRMLSSNPPSPANIARKRAELIAAAAETGGMADLEKVLLETSPKALTNHEAFEAKLDKTPYWERVVRRLNK